MTKLEFFNKFFFQWLFVRIARSEQRVIDEIDIDSFSINGGVSGRVKNSHIERSYCILYWIIPMTGWNGEYKYPFGEKGYKVKRLTKPIKV